MGFALLGLMLFSVSWIPNFGKSKLPHMRRIIKVQKLSGALKAAVFFLVKIKVTLLCASCSSKIQTILKKVKRKRYLAAVEVFLQKAIFLTILFLLSLLLLLQQIH